MSTEGHRLRSILEEIDLLVLPGVYDCLSAVIAEKTGFQALFTSGFGISATHLGRPDLGLLTATEVLSALKDISNSVHVPVVGDLDTGYGGPINVLRTVEEAVRSGAAGVILEDQQWPKRCGHFEGKRVISAQEHVEKIQAAVEARRDSGLVIIGRTDARASLGLGEALRRGRLYHESGADVVFVEAPQSQDELRRIGNELGGIPLFANMIEGGRTPILSDQALAELGFKIVVYPLTGLFSSARALAESFLHLKRHRTTLDLDVGITFPDFEKLIGVDYYRQLEERFAASSPVSKQSR
jgi:methylisocitrate lyase